MFVAAFATRPPPTTPPPPPPFNHGAIACLENGNNNWIEPTRYKRCRVDPTYHGCNETGPLSVDAVYRQYRLNVDAKKVGGYSKCNPVSNAEPEGRWACESVPQICEDATLGTVTTRVGGSYAGHWRGGTGVPPKSHPTRVLLEGMKWQCCSGVVHEKKR
jgi:hypothetical protein